MTVSINHFSKKNPKNTLVITQKSELLLNDQSTYTPATLYKISRQLNALTTSDLSTLDSHEIKNWQSNVEQLNLKIQDHNNKILSFRQTLNRDIGFVALLIYDLFIYICGCLGHDDCFLVEKIEDRLPHLNSQSSSQNLSLQNGNNIALNDCLNVIANTIIPNNNHSFHYYTLIIETLKISQFQPHPEINYGFKFTNKSIIEDLSAHQSQSDFVITLKCADIQAKNPKIVVESKLKTEIDNLHSHQFWIFNECVHHIKNSLRNLQLLA